MNKIMRRIFSVWLNKYSSLNKLNEISAEKCQIKLSTLEENSERLKLASILANTRHKPKIFEILNLQTTVDRIGC